MIDHREIERQSPRVFPDLLRVRKEVFAFHSAYQDRIEAVPTGERTPEGRIAVRNVNVGRVTLWGAEAGFGARVSGDVEIYGSLTFTWGEERLPGSAVTPASRIPPLSGQIGVFYRPHPAVWIDALVRYAFTQDRLSKRDRLDPRIAPDGTPGRALVHLRLGWRIHRTLAARLAIENLFDQDFREHGSGISVPGLGVTLAIEARL